MATIQVNNRRNKRTSRRNKTRQTNLVNTYENLLDRTTDLGDGTVAAPQDRFELKPYSNAPPATIPRNFSRQGYWVRASANLANVTSSTSVPVLGATAFQLSMINQYATYAGIFDQYCIAEIVLRITPNVNVANISTYVPGKLITVIDHDDDSTPATFGELRDYSTALETQGMIGQTRVIQPRVAIAAYNSVFSGYASQRTYIDCASPNVSHYGVKYGVSSSVGETIVYSFVADFIVHFRDLH